MKLEHSFEVDAPLETVWEALIDVKRVAPCLPGADISDEGEDGTYHGSITVKVGPATAAYRGTVHIEEADEQAHTVAMRATGTDKRGQGGAKALMHSTLTEREGGGTRVVVETDLTITGRLASFSRGGMMQDVSNRLLGEFASCLESSLAGDRAKTAAPQGAPADGETAAAAAPEAGGAMATALGGAPGGGGGAPPAPQGKPISALNLVLGVLRDRLRRLFGRRRP